MNSEPTPEADPTQLKETSSEVGASTTKLSTPDGDVQDVLAEISSPQMLVNRTLANRYQILSYLGGGGMSDVYKAQHMHLKNKVVALKLLKLRGSNENRVARLQQEAIAASSLSHPNIIAVQDFGHAGSTSYLVMEHFEGTSLENVINATGGLELERLLHIMAQICSALAHAHERGVVHRDIKPSNILIATDEQEKDLVKVVDFGIAKLTADDGKLTETGDVLGSPLYMSPEQCLGQQVDGRCDVYSLGCVLYEAITGQAPFQGENTFEIIYKHINEPPPPFPAKLLKNRTYQRLEAIVLKMLSKAPDQRYHFMVEVASDLKKLQYRTASEFLDVKLMWQLLKARRAAGSRSGVAIDTGLTATTLIAVVLSVMLLGLPNLVYKQALEEARCYAIMVELNQAFGSLGDDNPFLRELVLDYNLSGSRNRLHNRVDRAYRRVGYLVRNDGEKRKLYDDVVNEIRKAASVGNEMKQSIGGGIGAILSGMQGGALDSAFKVLTAWANVLYRNNELYASSVSSYNQYKGTRVFLQDTFEYSRYAAVACLLTMAALGGVRLRRKRKFEKERTRSQT